MNHTKRIYSLDYTKGMLALCVMFYHYTLWMQITPDLTHPLSRIAVYGVAAFFTLSGIANYHTHKENIALKPKSLFIFYLKRFLRIMPLYGVIITFTMILNFKKQYSWESIFLNYSSLFGFINPSDYIAVGGWFVGNIMVYYLLFPFIVYLLHKYKKVFFAFLIFCLSWSAYVAFFLISDTKTQAQQWAIYINPFTNLIFFVAGIYITTLKAIQVHKWLLRTGLILIAALFFLIPLSGDQIYFIYGWYRLVYIVLTLAFCALLFLYDFQFPNPFHKILLFLQHISYSVYLWHPVIFMLVSGINKIMQLHLSIYGVLGIAFICTIPVCYLSAKYIERIRIRWIQRLTKD